LCVLKRHWRFRFTLRPPEIVFERGDYKRNIPAKSTGIFSPFTDVAETPLGVGEMLPNISEM